MLGIRASLLTVRMLQSLWRLSGMTWLLNTVCRWGLGPMASRKKQLIAEGKLDKHGRPNAETPPEYLRALPDAGG